VANRIKKAKREIRGSGGELWGPDTDKDYDVLGEGREMYVWSGGKGSDVRIPTNGDGGDGLSARAKDSFLAFSVFFLPEFFLFATATATGNGWGSQVSRLPGNFHSSSTCRKTYALP
jgi:hypothetical protein